MKSKLTLPPWATPAIWSWGLALAALLIATTLLFARLGHYPLWDDEAMVALSARGILQTGDTSIDLDPNIVAYRNGLLVRGMHDRSTPPLAAYVTAGSFVLFGQSAFTARLPFALMGLATAGFLLWWIGRSAWALSSKAVFALALLGNVSFFLFSRQCRYYSPTILLSVLITYFYLYEKGRFHRLLLLSGLAGVLFAANYLAYAALALCLGLDYLIWRRHERRFSIPEIVALIGPQMVLIAGVVSVWNPFGTGFGEYVGTNSLGDRLTLLFWNFRDINECEFVVGGLILLAPIAGYFFKNTWLIRGFFALLVYVAFVTLVSPQLVRQTAMADVRYLIALIPLGFFLGGETLRVLGGFRPKLLIPIAVLAFGTNLFNGGPLTARGLQSSVANFAGELINPPGDPFTPAAAWISENLKPGESIFVVPGYMAYPLMFLEPRVVYAWQLSDPPRPDFRGLADIHFAGRTAPDYLIAFGPNVAALIQMFESWKPPGVTYEHVATLDHYWKDLYRPELFWRSFRDHSAFDRNREAIYIFKRHSSEVPPVQP